jgi:protein-tyrosine phosphatase
MNPLLRVRRTLGLLRRLRGAARGVAIQRLLEGRATRQRRLDRVLASRPSSVVFICHGNIMRSAFALEYARQHYPQLADTMLGAGTHATRGRGAQHSAITVATEMGIALDTHGATPFSELALDHEVLLLCMDRANEANVAAQRPELADRVFLIGDIDDGAGQHTSDTERVVSDPYALGDEATRQAFQRIVELVGKWAAALGTSRPG